MKASITERLGDPGFAYQLRRLSDEFIRSKDDEACLISMLKMHWFLGDLQRILKTSSISRARFEYWVKGGGRVDLALFHKDGGITFIEVKADGQTREIVGGIGQLYLYESLYLDSLPESNWPKYLNKILLSPTWGEKGQAVAQACANAGIAFFHYAPFSLIRQERAAFISSLQSHEEAPNG